MASTHVRHAPSVRDTATTPERPQTESRTSKLEDKLDYLVVQRARTLACKRGEKPTAWEDFKKDLAR